MKKIFTLYIYILFITVFSNNVIAQEFTLKISSKNILDNSVLKNIEFKKKHIDTILIYTEINKVSTYLKNIGYFTNTIDSVSKSQKKITAYYTLGKKIDRVIIRNSTINLLKLLNREKEKDSIIIPIEKLEYTLNSISKKLENKGESFSKIQLTNINIKNKDVFTDLEILQSKERKIDRVIIKGYELFSRSHLKYYFQIQEKTLFNKNKIAEISQLSKSLNFIKEIKEPEVLFTKDSTLLYLYLKKQQNNSFDGLINFSSNENGGILFNGYFDLELNNILNTGEQFKFLWNSIGNEKQELQVSTELPYLFNSPISPSFSFNIYKQDSTFLNTEFKTNITYNINPKTEITATYAIINSNNLQKSLETNNIEKYKNSFLGLKLKYSVPTNDSFKNHKFIIEIAPAFGVRKTESNTLDQFKLEFTTSYIWNINLRNSISITNKTGYLKSGTFLENELFRIGGANSIRGFNEQSIYTNNFSLLNVEYRFLTSSTSYLYTITDIAKVKRNNTNNDFIGLGIGYLFRSNNSLINLSSAIGQTNSTNLNFRNSKIIIGWKNYF